MKLTDEEVRLIHHLRGMTTCKITISKFAGKIVNVNVAADLSLRPEKPSLVVKISEPEKPLQ